MFCQAEYPPQGNCKSVTDALMMANNVHEEDVRYQKVGRHRRVFWRPKGPHTGGHGGSRIGL